MIINSSEFARNLAGWLKSKSPNNARYFSAKRNDIPIEFRNYTSKPLYLCLLVDLTFMGSVKEGKAVIGNFTDWYKDKNIAISNTIKYHKDPVFKILVTKKISQYDIILDIDLFSLFTGRDGLLNLDIPPREVRNALSNQQVLVNRNIKITNLDYDIIGNS